MYMKDYKRNIDYVSGAIFFDMPPSLLISIKMDADVNSRAANT